MVIYMKNRYRISLLVIAILLAFSMTVGTSYAYWTKTTVQTGTNEVTAGCLQIEINDLETDENDNLVSTSINLTNAYPISDEKGLQTKPYKLTVKNTCTIKAKYDIILNVLSASNLTENNMKYHVVKELPTPTTMTPALISTLEPASLDSSLISAIGAATSNAVQKSDIIETGVLEAQTDATAPSVTYNFRMWIDEATGTEVMGETFESAISVYAEATD